jgi:hypothetical protein
MHLPLIQMAHAEVAPSLSTQPPVNSLKRRQDTDISTLLRPQPQPPTHILPSPSSQAVLHSSPSRIYISIKIKVPDHWFLRWKLSSHVLLRPFTTVSGFPSIEISSAKRLSLTLYRTPRGISSLIDPPISSSSPAANPSCRTFAST